MSLDRLIDVASRYRQRVPHVGPKSLRVAVDGGEPVEVAAVDVENDTDGCLLVVTTKDGAESESEPQAKVEPKQPARRPARRMPQTQESEDAVPQQDRSEVRQAEGGAVEED